MRKQVRRWNDDILTRLDDPDGDLTDTFGGSLDVQVDETSRGGTAKYATIIHGNQSIQQPSAVRELITSSNRRPKARRPVLAVSSSSFSSGSERMWGR